MNEELLEENIFIFRAIAVIDNLRPLLAESTGNSSDVETVLNSIQKVNGIMEDYGAVSKPSKQSSKQICLKNSKKS